MAQTAAQKKAAADKAAKTKAEKAAALKASQDAALAAVESIDFTKPEEAKKAYEKLLADSAEKDGIIGDLKKELSTKTAQAGAKGIVVEVEGKLYKVVHGLRIDNANVSAEKISEDETLLKKLIEMGSGALEALENDEEE